MIKPRPKSILKPLAIWLTLIIIPVLIFIITIYLMVSYRPKAYHPIRISPQNQQMVLNEGMKKVEEFHNNLTSKSHFSYELSDHFINRQLACDDNQILLGKIAGSFKGLFKQPQIKFDDDIISIMGEVNHGQIRGILTISIQPMVESSGLTLKLLPLKIGALKLPEKIQTELMTPVWQEARKLSADYQRTPRKKELFDRSFGELVMKLPEFLQSGHITINPVIYPFEDIQARIDGIESNEGTLKLEMTSNNTKPPI